MKLETKIKKTSSMKMNYLAKIFYIFGYAKGEDPFKNSKDRMGLFIKIKNKPICVCLFFQLE